MDFLKVRFFVHWYRRLSIIPHFVLGVIYFSSVRFFFLCSESSPLCMCFYPLVSYFQTHPVQVCFSIMFISSFMVIRSVHQVFFFFCLYCVDGFLRWIVFVSVI
jgi:hypothetical protein